MAAVDKRSRSTGVLGTTTTVRSSLTNPLLSKSSRTTSSLTMKPMSHSSGQQLSKLKSSSSGERSKLLQGPSVTNQTSLTSTSQTSFTSQLSQEKLSSPEITHSTKMNQELLSSKPSLGGSASLLSSKSSLRPHTTSLLTSRSSLQSSHAGGAGGLSSKAPSTSLRSDIASAKKATRSSLLQGASLMSSSLTTTSRSLLSSPSSTTTKSPQPSGTGLSSSLLTYGSSYKSNLGGTTAVSKLTSSTLVSSSLTLRGKASSSSSSHSAQPLLVTTMEPKTSSLTTKNLLFKSTATRSKPSAQKDRSTHSGGPTTSNLLSTTTSKSLLSTSAVSKTKSSSSKLRTKLSLNKQRSLLGTEKKVAAETKSHDTPKVPVVLGKESERPQYSFSAERPTTAERSTFLPPELDASVQGPPAPTVDTVGLKTTLINSVATSLLCSPDFRSPQDTTRRSLVRLGEKMARYDPEFILKLALYTRCDLNIRTTANFLLALAANFQGCRPFLKKYYSSSIRLPSDWIEVAEIYQAFHDTSIKFGALPTALRKVMAARFSDFDAYQLAKYNKDSSKKKKKGSEKNDKAKEKQKTPTKPQPPVTSSSEDSDSDDDSSVVKSDTESPEELEQLSFTLKQLIRKIHIFEPVDHVMCLVGKRYPEDPEAFRKSRLPGTWDQDRAGKRMKLPTPETWETQVSTKGNKAKTWEDLIDHNKLPFMAMLRNLRNLILAGVSQKHHQWAVKKLNDERAVINSRQFPFRFFSAYEVLGELEKIADGIMPTRRPPKGAKGKTKKPPKELPKVDKAILQRYRTALDNALKIATNYNVKPIPGSTLILCNVGSNMNRPCTSARGLGKPRTVLEVGVLLGLMCKYSCEQCTMIIYGEQNFAEIQLREGTILDNMEQVMGIATSKVLGTNTGVIPSKFLHDMLIDRVPVDTLMVLSDTMNLADPQGKEMLDFLKKYRHLVNPNLLFVSVDLSGQSSGISSTIKPEHENDIFLAGYSDQILRFIAERGDTGQLTYVDNIDKAYNLKQIKLPSLDSSGSELAGAPSLGREKALLSAGSHQKWRTVRVFISSTFRDMHGERDLLTRFVFPELRARAHARQIKVYEVDLRWGVTEEAARSNKALEICLSEISRCQYFIGLLGQRYGWIHDEYQVPDTPEYDWLKEFPPRRSITEVEMHHAALCNPDKAVDKAFFYFRALSALDTVPKELKYHFCDESDEASEKIENLKDEIRLSGLEVYDNYPGRWLGVVDGKPMMGGLEDFGQRVLHNLWNTIQKDYPEDDLMEDPVAKATALHEAFVESRANTFVGRRALLKRVHEAVKEEDGGLVLLAGKPGSGKSAFMAAFAQHFMQSDMCKSRDLVVTHFIGAAPDSTNIASLLKRLCHEMKRRFNLPMDVPEDYPELVKDWPDFLEESVTTVGKGSRLLIVIDGIDLLEEKHNGRSMEWLPEKIPEGVVIVLSGVESGSCVALLRKRKPAPSEVIIGALDMWDKAEMVRQSLLKHRKALDESPFNNQMKLLLSKREANNPLYLHLACEELRVFGIFEQVTAYLKKIPPALSNLLQDILLRLEMEHDPDLLSTSLSLLSLVRSGLLEHELAGMLANYFAEKQEMESGLSEAVLPYMVISRLLRSLQGFLQPTGQENSNLLTLAHKEIEKAVRLRYMRGASSSKEKSYHQLLANFFEMEADPTGDKTFKSNSARAFSELPYHLMAAGAWKELEEILCNIHFVVAKCQLGLAQQLLEDYTPTPSELPPGKARDLTRFIQQPQVMEYRSFVSRNLHVLLSNPSLVLQQAVNEPDFSLVAKTAREILSESPRPLMTWLNKSNQTDPCQMKISSHAGAVTCVTVSQDSTYFAAGFKSSLVKLYRLSTGKEIHTFIGHASGITNVCFVGSHAVCSASRDSTLSLWDINEGIRIAVLKGHSRAVHGCMANQSGKSIASVSWDRSIKVWDGKTGKIQSTLQTKGQHNTPINCVSFHPEGQLIAVGSWDTTVKIWDTFNQKRLKVLKGHKSSVQACTYAPSGRHIVSAALDGEVRIWSTKSGSAVGTITGHHSPVNSLAFTPNGQYLVTASSDKLVKVWSGSLGQPVLSMGSSEHGIAHCLSFDQDTQTVHVGYHDGHVRKFNLHSGVEVFSVKPHSAAVVGLAYQEKMHMSASVDTTIKVWSPSTFPKCIELIGHDSPVSCATWDRKGFASASEDFTVLVWPHKPQYYAKQHYAVSPRKVQTSKKGRSKSTKGKGSEEEKVDDLKRKPLATIRSGHTGKITAIAFSCNGLKMVTASRDLSLIVWDTFSHKQIQVLHACHKDWINTCCFSDTSSDYLMTGSNDLTLKLWDLKSGTTKTTFKGHTSSINSVAFSRGCVVSAALDGSVKVWTHKGIEITTLYCHKQRVNSCFVIIPGKNNEGASSNWADIVSEEEEGLKSTNVKLDEISIVTASDDGTIGVWKPFLPNQLTSLVGHSDRVLSVATTLNNAVVSSSLDGLVQLWTPDLNISLKDTLRGHTGPITSTSCMAVSHDLTYCVTGGRDGHAILWSVKTDDGGTPHLEKMYQVKNSEKAVSSVCLVNAAAQTFAVGRDDGSMNTYSFTSTEYPSVDYTLPSGTLMGDHPVSKILVSADRKNVIAGSWSNQIVAIGGNRTVNARMRKHKAWVMDLVTTKEKGKPSLVYSIALDGTLCEWEVPADRSRPVAQMDCYAGLFTAIPVEHGVKDPAWPLGMCEIKCAGTSFLAISDSKGRIHLWNKHLKKIDVSKKLHQKAIHSVAVTTTGELVTGSEDGTIKMWNVKWGKNGYPTLTQVGQFHCQSGVTSISVIDPWQDQGKNLKPLLFVGDQLGHVTLLQWHK